MGIILVTNDDGINSDGLIRLAKAAKQFGEVWVVAPESQRSAASQSITLHTHIDVFPCRFPVEGIHSFTCSGTPADCVRAALFHLMPVRPDIVLTGINYGYNVATDVQYSATVGAALEASHQGIPAIALSEQACECHEVSDACLADILKMLIPARLNPGRILNVNFPGCPIQDFKGILTDRIVSRGAIYRDQYEAAETLPGEGKRLMIHGIYNEDAEEGTDFRAVLDGYISIGIINNLWFR